MTANSVFRAEDVSAAQRLLRETLGLAPQNFSAASFLEMIGEEIRQLLLAGHTPADIGAIIQRATGKAIGHEAIGHIGGRAASRRPDELNAANDG